MEYYCTASIFRPWTLCLYLNRARHIPLNWHGRKLPEILFVFKGGPSVIIYCSGQSLSAVSKQSYNRLSPDKHFSFILDWRQMILPLSWHCRTTSDLSRRSRWEPGSLLDTTEASSDRSPLGLSINRLEEMTSFYHTALCFYGRVHLNKTMWRLLTIYSFFLYVVFYEQSILTKNRDVVENHILASTSCSWEAKKVQAAVWAW